MMSQKEGKNSFLKKKTLMQFIDTQRGEGSHWIYTSQKNQVQKYEKLKVDYKHTWKSFRINQDRYIHGHRVS